MPLSVYWQPGTVRIPHTGTVLHIWQVGWAGAACGTAFSGCSDVNKMKNHIANLQRSRVIRTYSCPMLGQNALGFCFFFEISKTEF